MFRTFALSLGTAALIAPLPVAAQTLGDVINSLTALDAEVDVLTTNVSNQGASITGLNANIGALDTQVTALDANVGTLGMQVTGLNANIGALDTQVTVLDTNVGTLGTQVTGLNANVGALDTQVTVLDTNVGTLGTQVTGLNANVGALGTQVTVLDTSVGTLGTQVTGLNANVGALDTQVTVLDTNVGTLGAQMTGLNADLNAMNDQVDELAARVDAFDPSAKIVQSHPKATVAIAAASAGEAVSFAGTAGDRRLTGVAPGVEANDAATIGQMTAADGATLAAANGYTDRSAAQTLAAANNYTDRAMIETLNRTGQMIAADNVELRRDMSALAAGSNALAALPQAFIPGRGMVGASIGGSRGQTAFAMGVSKAFVGKRAPVFRAGMAVDTRRGDFSYNAAVGFHF